MRTGRAAVLPPPLGLLEPPRAARWTSLVPAGLVLLSVGMIVVSVLHDLQQCCIIIDTQHLLQELQSCCTAVDWVSCASCMTNMMNLIDVGLCSEPELVRLPNRAAIGCCSTGWCSTARAVRQPRGVGAGDRVRWQQLVRMFLTCRGSLHAALAL